MARRVKLGSQLPYGKWIPVQAVKFNRGGGTQIKTAGTAKRKRRRNIALGHYFEDDQGNYKFHPIRTSWDYDPSRLKARGKGSEYARWKKSTGARKRKKSTAKKRRKR